jgi:hypothetical protein
MASEKPLGSRWVIPHGRPKAGQLLSEAQQRRYMRSGMTKSEYESGASVKIQRGHGRTPEHKPRTPEEHKRIVDKFPSYKQAVRVIVRAGEHANEEIIGGLNQPQRSMIAKHRNTVIRMLGLPETASGLPASWKKYPLSYFKGKTVTDPVTGKIYEFETRMKQLEDLGLRVDLAHEAFYPKVK